MTEQHGKALRERLEAPKFNKMLKQWVGRGELDYEVYLQTRRLLALQFTAEERVTHDELLFQIAHQTQELWLKLVSEELAAAIDLLDADDLWGASALLERAARIGECLVHEMAVIETLTPARYQALRRNLGNGSGQESPGYNALRLATDATGEALARLLARREVALVDVYASEAAPDIRHVAERCVDLDEALQRWLMRHFLLVRRTIGVDAKVQALDGLPTRVLAGRMSQPFFPALWDVRVQLTAGWSREGGTPTADRWAARARAEAGADDERCPVALVAEARR